METRLRTQDWEKGSGKQTVEKSSSAPKIRRGVIYHASILRKVRVEVRERDHAPYMTRTDIGGISLMRG